MPKSAVPKAAPSTLFKATILDQLRQIDEDQQAKNRILRMETAFRAKMSTLSANAIVSTSSLRRFNTNPFVLMALSYHKQYDYVWQIENDIIVSKAFPSMETSAGRMVEQVILPAYSWKVVPSGMHTLYSVIDGELVSGSKAQFVTLKSGPRTMNDDVVRGISTEIATNYTRWAVDKGVKVLDIVIGILYGTYKQSNKKDWHILDEVRKLLEANGIAMTLPPEKRWDCAFSHGGIDVNLSVKIGAHLWEYIGGTPHAFLEICIAVIRACVRASGGPVAEHTYTIPDLAEAISLTSVPDDFNVSILQRSQLEWLFLLAAHFCDVLC